MPIQLHTLWPPLSSSGFSSWTPSGRQSKSPRSIVADGELSLEWRSVLWGTSPMDDSARAFSDELRWLAIPPPRFRGVVCGKGSPPLKVTLWSVSPSANFPSWKALSPDCASKFWEKSPWTWPVKAPLPFSLGASSWTGWANDGWFFPKEESSWTGCCEVPLPSSFAASSCTGWPFPRGQSSWTGRGKVPQSLSLRDSSCTGWASDCSFFFGRGTSWTEKSEAPFVLSLGDSSWIGWGNDFWSFLEDNSSCIGWNKPPLLFSEGNSSCNGWASDLSSGLGGGSSANQRNKAPRFSSLGGSSKGGNDASGGPWEFSTGAPVSGGHPPWGSLFSWSPGLGVLGEM